MRRTIGFIRKVREGVSAQLLSRIIWIASAVLLLMGVWFLVGSKTGSQDISSLPAEAVPVYRERIALRFQANRLEEPEEELVVPENQPFGYLTRSQIGGVRMNPDESVWIVVIVKDENRWLEFYGPRMHLNGDQLALKWLF